MTVFAVTYSYESQPAELARLRPDRHAFFDRLQSEGSLLASGQLIDSNLGHGMLVVAAPSAEHAAALLDADPYVRAGLVSRRSISEWNPTSGAWVAG